MCVAIASEPATLGRLIDRRLEHPEVLFRVAQGKNRFGLNTLTLLFEGHFQQIRMTDILRVVVLGCGGQPCFRDYLLWLTWLHLAPLNWLRRSGLMHRPESRG